MSRSYIHYEAAFEDYLRSRGLPYLAVDEQRKAVFAGARIKSFDFLVSHPAGVTFLIDVKGRKFPYEIHGALRFWENWVTADDLRGLSHWETAFGSGFQSLLVFAYWLSTTATRLPSSHVYDFHGEPYCFLAVPLPEYRSHCRLRSPRWQTFSVPVRRFRQMARPMNLVC